MASDDELIENSNEIWLIKITSKEIIKDKTFFEKIFEKETKLREDLQKEKVEFEIINPIKGKTYGSGTFFHNLGACNFYVEHDRAYIYFHAEPYKEILTCQAYLKPISEPIKNLNQLTSYLKNEKIKNISSMLSWRQSLCAENSSNLQQCEQTLERLRKKYCVMGNDNPPECNSINKRINLAH